MPELLAGAVFIGILTVVAVIVLRARAARPRLSVWRLTLIGVAMPSCCRAPSTGRRSAFGMPRSAPT